MLKGSTNKELLQPKHSEAERRPLYGTTRAQGRADAGSPRRPPRPADRCGLDTAAWPRQTQGRPPRLPTQRLLYRLSTAESSAFSSAEVSLLGVSLSLKRESRSEPEFLSPRPPPRAGKVPGVAGEKHEGRWCHPLKGDAVEACCGEALINESPIFASLEGFVQFC